MANGGHEGLSWEWACGVLLLGVTGFLGFWNNLLHGRLQCHDRTLTSHGEHLARLNEMCETQLRLNAEVKDSIGKVHGKLDRLIDRHLNGKD